MIFSSDQKCVPAIFWVGDVECHELLRELSFIYLCFSEFHHNRTCGSWATQLWKVCLVQVVLLLRCLLFSCSHCYFLSWVFVRLLSGSKLSFTSHYSLSWTYFRKHVSLYASLIFNPRAWAQTFGLWDVHFPALNGPNRRQLSFSSSDQNLSFSRSPDLQRGMSWASRRTFLDTSIVFFENLITIWLVGPEQFKFEDRVWHK